MTVVTSTTGIVSAAVTPGSTSVPVVIREDVYKGVALVGTAYRNISLVSSFPDPLLPNNKLTTIDVFTSPPALFGLFQTQSSTSGASSLCGPTSSTSRFRVYRSTNAADPLPRFKSHLYVSANPSDPPRQCRVALSWDTCTFPITLSATIPDGTMTALSSFAANQANTGTGTGTGNYAYPVGLNWITFQLDIPVGSFVDITRQSTVTPSDLTKYVVLPVTVYYNNSNNDPSSIFNPVSGCKYQDGTSGITWTFRIPYGNRVGPLYIQGTGNFQLFNQTTQLWQIFTCSPFDGPYNTEIDVTGFSTSTSVYQEVIMKGYGGVSDGGRIMGFSYLSYPNTITQITTAMAVFKDWNNVSWAKDNTSASQVATSPFSFTVTNASTGPYHHFRWTKVPAQLTNVVYSGNDLSATWNPTYNQSFDFQITLYDINDNILDTRTNVNPRTVAANTTTPPLTGSSAPNYSFVETRLINSPFGTPAGAIGGYDIITGEVTCSRYDTTNPRVVIPAYTNQSDNRPIGQYWTGTQPVPNYYISFGPISTALNLAGQHNQWPFFGPGILNYNNSPVRPIGLEYWDFEFDRGPVSTDGSTTYLNVATQLPLYWKIKHARAVDCYFSNDTDWALSQFLTYSSPHQYDVNMGGVDVAHSDAVFAFKINMATAADSRLYISFYNCIVFVKPDNTQSQPYEGYPNTGTLTTQMRVDASYYTVVNNVATVRLKRGQLSTSVGNVASFDYLSKI